MHTPDGVHHNVAQPDDSRPGPSISLLDRLVARGPCLTAITDPRPWEKKFPCYFLPPSMSSPYHTSDSNNQSAPWGILRSRLLPRPLYRRQKRGDGFIPFGELPGLFLATQGHPAPDSKYVTTSKATFAMALRNGTCFFPFSSHSFRWIPSSRLSKTASCEQVRRHQRRRLPTLHEASMS